jgi:hypothetical protein
VKEAAGMVKGQATGIMIVPDVHGRDFWLPALEHDGEVVFLGDYTDPYPAEGFKQADAYRGLTRIVEFKRQNPARVTLLVGNHELHYHDPEYACSRFDRRFYRAYHELLTGETAPLFQVCRQVGRFLFVHAGVTKGWFDAHAADLSRHGETLEGQLNGLFARDMAAFNEVSWSRGGYHASGSPLWADASELFDEPAHFDDSIVQVIGHTQHRDPDPVIKGNVCLLDNQKLYLLKDDKVVKYSPPDE